MYSSPEYSIALDLISKYHEGQKDIGGEPYLLHLYTVSDNIFSWNTDGLNRGKVVGLLHDIMEDCGVTESDLSLAGISNETIRIVKILTHDKSDTYADYIIKISQDPIATLVKIEDLKHNMDITRLKKLDNNAIKRLRKYFYSYKFLTKELSQEQYINKISKLI